MNASYLIAEPYLNQMHIGTSSESVFINARLTSTGRQLASLGRIRFTRVVLSDSEVDYRFENEYTDLGDGFIIPPPDTAPIVGSFNFDGTPAILLQPENLKYGKYIEEASRADFEFFTSANTRFYLNEARTLAFGNAFTSNLVGTNELPIENIAIDPSIGGTAVASDYVGQLLLVRFAAPKALGAYSYDMLDDAPYVSLWYRIQSYSSNSFFLDRTLPNFAAGTGIDYASFYIYPWSGVSYYASASTADTRIWNMNIVRTINEIGSSGATSAYTTYGSITYNGTKHTLGFNTDQRAIGVIHDGNKNLDSNIIDRFDVSGTTLHLQTLLWHRKPEYIPGKGNKGGHSFTDRKSKIYYDQAAKMTYSVLKDGTDNSAIEVGRVYHDIRTIVITHPELLTAMTYKSNRNWTLPPLSVRLQSNYLPNTTGLCLSDYTYLVTYVMSANTTYASASTFAYRNFLHCSDIAVVESKSEDPHLLVAQVSNTHFPYLRSTGKIGSLEFSGTGWNANAMNILVKEIPTSSYSGLSSVSHTGWKKLSGGGAYSLPGGESTISASGLSSYQFTMTRADYLSSSATDYNIGVLTGNDYDRTFSGLSYGDEAFFYGDIEYTLIKDPERVSLKFALLPDKFNSTKNTTFSSKNESTYITALYILDDLNRVVAVAKPTHPIKKNYGRYIEFQIDLIF